MDRADLKIYQQTAIDFLLYNPFSALWLDMGLGKTVSVLTMLADLLELGLIQRVLIVAPIKVAVRTWPNEIAKWDHLKHLQFQVIRPTGDEPEITETAERARRAAEILRVPRASVAGLVARAETQARERVRRALARRAVPIHLINRERVMWLARFWGSRWPYDTVIFDEASGLRDYKSERFKAMSAVRKYLVRMHQLSATPRPESYMDLFPQIWLLDKGERLGSNITAYRDQYFTLNPYKRKWEIKNGAADQIIEKISDLVLDMKARDYLKIDRPVFVDRPVYLSEEHLALYRELEATSILDLPEGVIEAETAGALFQKLMQFASGFMYDANRKVHMIHEAKLDDLELIVEETLGQPMLVAYHYKPSLAALKKRFKHAVVLSPDGREEAAWNRGEIPMLLFHPASSAHGQNLQFGGSLMSFFDIPASNENYEQSVGRLPRPGQKDVVRIFLLRTIGTEDEHSVARLLRKQSDQDYMFHRLAELRAAAKRRKTIHGAGR